MLDSHATKYPSGTVLSPYDATLNQTDIATNKNKFYIIQIISHGSDFSLFTRYGRIGESGVISYVPGTKASTIDKFKTTFKSKTKNTWIDAFGTPTATAGNDVSKFVKYGDKYFLCQKSLPIPPTSSTASPTSLSTSSTTSTVAPVTTPVVVTSTVAPIAVPITTPVVAVTTPVATHVAPVITPVTHVATPVVPVVTSGRPLLKPIIVLKKPIALPDPIVIPAKPLLDRRIVRFLELVGSMKMLYAALKTMNIDTEKMPLGQISQEQLSKADAILNDIKNLLTSGLKKEDSKYMTKSSEYYTLVPIVVGRTSRPPIINTMEIIGKYSDRIDELKNLKVAYNAVNSSTNMDLETQYENLYKSLKTTITPIDKGTSIWNIIENYVLKTHGQSHRTTSNVEVSNIFEITRESDHGRNISQEFPNMKGIENLQLLWHGTRLGNYISILQNGLVLRPELISNAHITGKMFGNGIYAANSFSKSLNYCSFGDTNNDACLFLGEFMLGDQLKLTQSDSGLNQNSMIKANKHSTWGMGKSTPSSYTTIPSCFDSSLKVQVPDGNLSSSNINSSLLYDEFIVYNEKQLRLRYIIQIKVK